MQELGEYLRQKRREQSVRLEDVAHVTRIPERSLRLLEAGEVDKLPGDVFVRGFVRAYAEFVGFDPTDALSLYNRGAGESPISEAEPTPELPAPPEPTRTFFPPALRGSEASKRGPVTLAVIILVIVATLTMSYLLRTPSSSGDGITRVDDPSAEVLG